jgi:colicin import membrane protein
MKVRDIPTTAVDSYLKLVRVPLDGAIRLLPGNGAGAKPAAKLALDRIDATVRAMIAEILGDGALREDAERRRAAADEREQALRLHAEAQRAVDQADARLAERRRQADRQRQQAREHAETKREDADRRRQRQVRRAVEVRNDRVEKSRNAADRVETAVEEDAARDRLEALDAKTDALRKREKELTARDEAERLRRATGRAKAERKRD